LSQVDAIWHDIISFVTVCKKGYKNNSLGTFVPLQWLPEDDTMFSVKCCSISGDVIVKSSNLCRSEWAQPVPVAAGAGFCI
ncbi:MAG: hypothetical protein ACI4S2_01660, partial [Lachnospiraceae bacterium]